MQEYEIYFCIDRLAATVMRRAPALCGWPATRNAASMEKILLCTARLAARNAVQLALALIDVAIESANLLIYARAGWMTFAGEWGIRSRIITDGFPDFVI